MSDTGEAPATTEESKETAPVTPAETPPSALDEVFDEAPPEETPEKPEPEKPTEEGEAKPEEKKEGEAEKKDDADPEAKEGDAPKGEEGKEDPKTPEVDTATDERLKATHTKLQEMGEAVRRLEMENRRLLRQAAGEDPDELTDVEAARENWLLKADASERMVKPLFPDYDEVVGLAGSGKPSALALAAKPALANRVLSAPNPAMEMYNIGQEYLIQQKYGNTPEEIRAKLREEVTAEVKADLVKEAKEKETKRKAAPAKKAGVPEAATLRDVETSSDSSSEKAIEPKSALDEVFPD